VAWAEAYLHTKWHLDPCSRLATIDMGQKLGASALFLGRGAGSQSNTMSLGSRLTFLPSGILIHRATWPQQIWAENWGLCPFGGGNLYAHLTQWGQGRAYMHGKFHFDPSKRLATIHQRYTQTGQDKTGQTDYGPIG